MKKWIARKLFDWAVRLDWDATLTGAKSMVLVEITVNGLLEQAMPKKRGRPAGRKDSVGPKKVGRPLGRKDSAPRKRKVTPA